MTNLPITASAPQATASVNQNTNAADENNAQGDNAFGNVLARQIKEPAAEAKADSKPDSATAQNAATDSDKIAADVGSTLPADMLAALLPQVIAASAKTETAAGTATMSSSDAIEEPAIEVNAAGAAAADTTNAGIAAGVAAATTAAAPAGTPAGATTATVNTGASAKTASGSGEIRKHLSDAGKGEIAAATTRPAASDNAATLAKSAEAAFAKDSKFNAAMDSATKSKVAELITAATREAQAAPVAPQAGSVALASLQNNAPAVLMPAQVAVNVPVGSNRWGDEFSQKITWLATQKDQTAELHLNPPQLGPLDVVLKVSGDQATAMFTSPHAAVREAIEQAMPKLRDMLADSGITLGNTTVSDQSPRDNPKGSESSRQSAAGRDNGADISKPITDTSPRVSQISRHNGIVDTFA